MKPSEALDKAVEIINRDGWIQGDYYQPPSPDLSATEYVSADDKARRSAPCCQRGAVIRAVNGTWEPEEELSKADKRTILRAHGYCRRLTDNNPIKWNDAEGRTKEEVVGMLKAAAELARGAGE